MQDAVVEFVVAVVTVKQIARVFCVADKNSVAACLLHLVFFPRLTVIMIDDNFFCERRIYSTRMHLYGTGLVNSVMSFKKSASMRRVHMTYFAGVKYRLTKRIRFFIVECATREPF